MKSADWQGVKTTMKQLFIILSFFIASLAGDIEFNNFVGIHENLPKDIESFLDLSGMTKSVWHYDNKEEKDGQWLLYPFIQLNKSSYLINVSYINENKEPYNYLLLVSSKDHIEITDTIGPFWDDYVRGANFSISKENNIQKLTLQVFSDPVDDDDDGNDTLEYFGSNYKFELKSAK